MGDEPYTVTLDPRADTDGVPPLMVVLHGYGADERDLLALASHFDPRLRVVSIRAPLALMQGGYAWFPVGFTEQGLTIDQGDAEKARADLVDVVRDLQAAHGNDHGNTLLLGFSQGASMALAAALSAPDTAVGVIALSGVCVPEMMPTDADIMRALAANSILMTHGRFDPLIPIDQSHASRDLVAQTPVRLTYREYPMAHEISQDCLAHVAQWLTDFLHTGGRRGLFPSAD